MFKTKKKISWKLCGKCGLARFRYNFVIIEAFYPLFLILFIRISSAYLLSLLGLESRGKLLYIRELYLSYFRCNFTQLGVYNIEKICLVAFVEY